MKQFLIYGSWLLTFSAALLFFPSCEKFMNPEQELAITEDKLYDDWYEYRSIEMGLYGLQQDLVEQLLVLGELRGDLLEITPNADADLVEIYNFNPSRTNRYASPTNFFKLIAACNNFIHVLETEHPEILDPESPITNYDRLYGEALCMRAWAYFNAVRIYGKIPYIHESLTTIEEIEEYVESPGTYTDSVHIIFNRDGYQNDTLLNEPFELEKRYYDLDLVLDHFINQLENDVKAVGVNHYIDNNDVTWEITIWNDWALHALLGHMYLTQGDLVRAARHFGIIMRNTSETYRYHVTNSFSYGGWANIFSDIDNKEHIYTIWFSKTYFQQNRFQELFEPWIPNQYMLKPTYQAILKWESVFRNQVYLYDNVNPSKTRMAFPGIPSDFYRGIGASFLYARKNGVSITSEEYENMIMLRRDGDDRSSRIIMENMDTIVYKYSVGKNRYSHDANYIIYRAGGIHLYMAEIFVYWRYDQNGIIKENIDASLGLVNDGSIYYGQVASRPEIGIRGRVGLSGTSDKISVANINYLHDPFTNKITGYIDLTGNFIGKQEYLEEQILHEKARELAFEGERFYDLMRVAKRRNDPSFLAEIVSSKFPAGKREEMYNFLLDENNWYINYFD
ncbi:MAG: RagB/SusD family nutrient uptake outer membrane protein [Bacteroidales bacterium]|nr:RagB/SusD family nutrient uptake outer membrane protein [Bacteroidales bacterium]